MPLLFTLLSPLFSLDLQYHKHESGEINFWVPLVSRVWDGNTLHAESAPGKGDFRPYNLGEGYVSRHMTTSIEITPVTS